MGRTSGFTIDWPVGIPIEDGRTFIVEPVDDGSVRVSVEGIGEWRSLGTPLRTLSIGSVVGHTLHWRYETTGELAILAPTAH
jgi:hypothetical protein